MNIEWNKNTISKITETKLNPALYGEMIVAFSYGVVFTVRTIWHSYYILIASTQIITSYLRNNVMNWYKNMKVDDPTGS